MRVELKVAMVKTLNWFGPFASRYGVLRARDLLLSPLG